MWVVKLRRDGTLVNERQILLWITYLGYSSIILLEIK
jgi:hypothetical protein